MDKAGNKVQADANANRYLAFLLDKDVYAVEVRYVVEIVGILPITKVPETPPYVKGVVNLRGQIIPVMDMRIKFHKPEIEYNDRTCVVVVHIGSVVLGLIVDSVIEVLTITEEHQAPPPSFITGEKNPYIKAVDNRDKHVKLLLDCEKLLIDEDLLLIENLNNKN